MNRYTKFSLFAFLFLLIVFSSNKMNAQIEQGYVEGWVVRDANISEQIISYLKEYLELNDKAKAGSVNYYDDVVLFKSKRPSSPEYPIVGLRVGGSYELDNAEKVFIALGKTLYDFVKDRDRYPWEIYEFDTKVNECQVKADNATWWTPLKTQFSAFHSLFKIQKTWGFDANIGLDQINMPWWWAGVFRAGFIHQNVRIGIQGPVSMGNSTSAIRQRMLDAGWGGYLAFNVDGFFGEMSYSDYVKSPTLDTVSTLYFLTFGGQLGYSFFVDISDVIPATLKISVGGEYHQVGQGHQYILDAKNNKIPTKDITKDKRNGEGGPYVRFDLNDCGKDSYEAFAQYSNSSIMLGGAYNITKALGIEARWVITEPIRTRNPWEYPTMFMISPRIRF